MIEWIVIVGLVVAMYIVIYKYEKKMEHLQKRLDEHQDKIDMHCDKLKDHHERLEKHDNHIEEMWVTIPKSKE